MSLSPHTAPVLYESSELPVHVTFGGVPAAGVKPPLSVQVF
jgi:hypothetical protein